MAGGRGAKGSKGGSANGVRGRLSGVDQVRAALDAGRAGPWRSYDDLAGLSDAKGPDKKQPRGGVMPVPADALRDHGLTRDGARITGPFSVEASTFEPISQRYGLLLRFRDRGGTERSMHIERGDLHAAGAPWLRELASAGLHIEPGKKAQDALASCLANLEPEEEAYRALKCGWFDAPERRDAAAVRAYILPDQTFAPAGGPRVVFDAGINLSTFGVGGDIEGWHREVGAIAQHQSRMVLAVGVALAGPLLALLGEEGGVVHLRGGSSIGKSLALRVGASVFGAEIRTWRATANAVEGQCLLHNDNMLLLDEVGQGSAEDVSAAAYAITNGRGKGRMRADRAIEQPSTWRVMVLSSGEIGLADQLAADRQRVMVGQTIRFLDIAADAGAGHGVFDTLCSFTSAAKLAEVLRAATGRCKGLVGRAFLQALVAEPDLAALVDELDDWRQGWMGLNTERADDGQIHRAAGRFGLIFAALRYAIERKILPWDLERTEKAMRAVWDAWVENRGGRGSGELAMVLERLQATIDRHGASRFARAEEDDGKGRQTEIPWQDPAAGPAEGAARPAAAWVTQLRMGFVFDGGLKNVSLRRLYGFTHSTWREEVLLGLDPKTICRALRDRKILVGFDGRHNARLTRVGGQSMRLYVIDPEALHAALDPSAPGQS